MFSGEGIVADHGPELDEYEGYVKISPPTTRGNSWGELGLGGHEAIITPVRTSWYLVLFGVGQTHTQITPEHG